MNQIFQRSQIFLIVSAFLLTIISSCDKDMSVSLDQSSSETLGLTVIDSITVHASTQQLDNLPSTETRVLLVGKANSPVNGIVKSSSYFRVTLEEYSNDIPESASFDSINLILKPSQSKYYFGDTTSNQKVSVHQLTQALETTDITKGPGNYEVPVYVEGPSIFNDQKFDFDPNPLGELTFRPRVNSIDSLNIKLNDSMGKNLFDLVKQNDKKVSSVEDFQEYLKGLVLVADDMNTTVLGISDSLQVRVNYSYMGDDGFKKTGFKSIRIGEATYQHNHIEYDRSNTLFSELGSSTNNLKSSETDGLVFIQSGTGAVAKLDIPSLNEFMYTPGIVINKAELVIETTSSASSMFLPPPSLMLFIANSNGVPDSFVTSPFSTSIQQAIYSPGNNTGRNASYTFNMISYLKTINEETMEDKSLMVAASAPSLFNSVNTAVIATENNKPKIKLNIVYTKFQ